MLENMGKISHLRIVPNRRSNLFKHRGLLKKLTFKTRILPHHIDYFIKPNPIFSMHSMIL